MGKAERTKPLLRDKAVERLIAQKAGGFFRATGADFGSAVHVAALQRDDGAGDARVGAKFRHKRRVAVGFASRTKAMVHRNHPQPPCADTVQQRDQQRHGVRAARHGYTKHAASARAVKHEAGFKVCKESGVGIRFHNVHFLKKKPHPDTSAALVDTRLELVTSTV